MSSKDKALRKLQKIETYLQDNERKFAKDAFLEKFMICETVCKSVISDYYAQRNEIIDEKDITLDMRTIPHALKKARIIVDMTVQNKLFIKKETPGEKSAKILRHRIAHSMSIDDMEEIFNRRDELILLMDSFLLSFR